MHVECFFFLFGYWNQNYERTHTMGWIYFYDSAVRSEHKTRRYEAIRIIVYTYIQCCF